MSNKAGPVLIERERCAELADELAKRWEATAEKMRNQKTRFLWIGPFVQVPGADRDARCIDAAAYGLRAVSRLIREGARNPTAMREERRRGHE